MRTITMRKTWIALALVASILACKGESPTAPAPGTGGNPPPGGSTPPPTGVQVTLTVSNAEPLVDSSVVVTAAVTQDGTAVPNGTAVEFVATGGSFGTTGQSIVRTTTNGSASVTITSSAPGAVEVRAVVGNVQRTTTVTFRTRPVVEPPVSTAPAITSITPAIGRPSGGETITILGRNFRSPVRVIFRTEDGQSKEGLVLSVSETQIQVMSPGINLGVGQQAVADIILITEAGTASEQRLENSGAFTFRNTQLTPVISTITPNSGPVTGNTRVEIFGQGFQAPVQVLFGTAEARVISVDFGRIEVETPAGRDTSPGGSDVVTGPVTVTVRNIASQTSAEMGGGFHYKSDVQVIAVGPTEGPSTGGTQIEIIGHGFLAPVTVTVAGVAAQPTFVSGTKIIAITNGVEIEGCADVSGPVVVTNLANGDSDEGVEFTYEAPTPIILGVSPSPATPGSSVTITVANAGLFPQIKFGEQGVPITSSTTSGGITALTTTVPLNIELDTTECPSGGTRQTATTFDVTFVNAETECETTLTGGLTVAPPAIGRMFLEPNPLEITATGNDPATPEDETTNGSGIFTVTNTGGADLTITGVALTSGDPARFVVDAGAVGTTLSPCDTAVVAVTYNAGAPGSTHTGVVTVSASSGGTTITARETVIGRTE